MTEHKKEVGRLALRQHDDWWVAYYGLPETMDLAIKLGSIRIGGVVGNDKNKKAFINLMREMVADLIEEETGERPIWGDPQSAPEHER